jgi:DNA-binding CsgD family transcriptional regulator
MMLEDSSVIRDSLLADVNSAVGERRQRRENDRQQLRWIARARSLDALLDLLPQPLLLVGPGDPITVWHANAAARCRCTATGPVRLAGDKLTLDGSNGPTLQRALQEAIARGQGHRQHIELATAADESPTILVVEAVDFGACSDLPVTQLAMVEIQQRPLQEPPLEALCREFGLTRAEAATAFRLVAMGSADVIACDTGKSIHTIRTQLKAAMLKTGTHSQASLVALLARRLSP